ncbi:MAG: hypothetical protein J0H44_30825 [Alphaproteobacteria bacterium]|nr:hypothetical protein [Alphaproteobacteria bacterium]
MSASRSIVLPNFCGDAGSCDPSIVMVALDDPGLQVICWACPIVEPTKKRTVESARMASRSIHGWTVGMATSGTLELAAQRGDAAFQLIHACPDC